MAVKSRISYVPLPEKQWMSRASLLLMTMCALALLIMSSTHNPWALRLRTSITDAVQNAGAWVSEMAQLREENLMLKNQNIQLLQWQQAARSMAAENASLHNLLNVVPSQKNKFTTVKVISDAGGPYMRSALISGGSDNAVHKDQAVINENGLIGRVVEAGASSARVLLLGDINSRIPVMAEHAHEKSILIGNNSDLPSLAYLSADSKIQVGERIVTSGDGGIFPEGIPVGVVTAVSGGKVHVQPFADMARAAYVSVIDYSF
jgi:rod shape-determining protein MreC